jgi:hypothetical protein
MGISYNPRIVTDGLVLALDGANLKSYSQNVFPYPLDGYSWGTSGYQMTVSRDTSTSSPVGNSPLKLVTSGTSAYTNTYNSLPFTLSPAAQGQTWTFSFWVKGSSSFSASMLIFESNSSGNYTAYGQPYYSVTTEWTRVSGSYTMTQATTAGVQVRIDCYVNGVTLWVDGFQLEKASSASSFNSISNTNGTTWRDLIGNGNTGTLTNGPTYSSANNGSIVFDGVDDRIECGTFSVPYLTVSTWVYKTSSATNQGICRKETGWAVSQYNGTLQVAPGTSWTFYDTGYTIPLNTWVNIVYTYSGTGTTGSQTVYINGSSIYSTTAGSGPITANSNAVRVGFDDNNWFWGGRISNTQIYNRALSASEIQQNYNALKGRYEKGGINNPFTSPTEARLLGYTSGDYYFKSGSMSSPQLLEFQRDYYENRGWVCVFRSPYRSTATTNKIDLNIPMDGLLVQRDTLDLRGAVYWSTPITYNTVLGSGNNTADSGTGYAGSNARRVMLGGGGGHGIYRTDQSQCNWGNSTGAIGAGWDGVNCGSFPNDLVWGTGNANPAYENRSGTWSHWITWS